MIKRPRAQNRTIYSPELSSWESMDMSQTPYRLPSMMMTNPRDSKSPSIYRGREGHHHHHQHQQNYYEQPPPPVGVTQSASLYTMKRQRYWTGNNVQQAMIMPSPPPYYKATDPFDPLYKSLLKNRSNISNGRPVQDPSPSPAEALSRNPTYYLFHPQKPIDNDEFNERGHWPSPQDYCDSPDCPYSHHAMTDHNNRWPVTALYDNTFSLPVRSLKAKSNNKKLGVGSPEPVSASRDFTVHCMAPYNWLKRKWGFQYRQTRQQQNLSIANQIKSSPKITPGYLIHNAYGRDRILAAVE